MHFCLNILFTDKLSSIGSNQYFHIFLAMMTAYMNCCIQKILKCIMKTGFSHTQSSILHTFLYLSFHSVSINLAHRNSMTTIHWHIFSQGTPTFWRYRRQKSGKQVIEGMERKASSIFFQTSEKYSLFSFSIPMIRKRPSQRIQQQATQPPQLIRVKDEKGNLSHLINMGN